MTCLAHSFKKNGAFKTAKRHKREQQKNYKTTQAVCGFLYDDRGPCHSAKNNRTTCLAFNFMEPQQLTRQVRFVYVGSLAFLQQVALDFNHKDAVVHLQKLAADALKCGEPASVRVLFTTYDLAPLPQTSLDQDKVKRQAERLAGAWSKAKDVIATTTTSSPDDFVTIHVTRFNPASVWISKVLKSTNIKGLVAACPEMRRLVEAAAAQRYQWALKVGALTGKISDRDDLARAALQQDGILLACMPGMFQCDKETVLQAVQNCGSALCYASFGLKDDPDVVLPAVQQFGDALRYASAELRANPTVVLAAVQQFGDALRYASAELQDIRVVVQAAVRQSGRAIRYASCRLQRCPYIMQLAEQWQPRQQQQTTEHIKDARLLQADRSVVRAIFQEGM